MQQFIKKHESNAPVWTVGAPMVQQNLARLRDHTTWRPEFRQLIGSLGRDVFTAGTLQLEMSTTRVITPLGEMEHPVPSSRLITLAPVMRAGIGMLYPCLEVTPHAGVSFIYGARDENSPTKASTVFGDAICAEAEGSDVFLLETILATGQTLKQTIKLFEDIGASSVSIISIIAAQPGIDLIHDAYPKVKMFCAAVDRELNEDLFVLKGFGDGGDRQFGPKRKVS